LGTRGYWFVELREPRSGEEGNLTALVLWLLAVVFVISGIGAIVRGAAVYGLALIVIGLMVGPGGVSVFT
jgi:hypothetical protein